jgi:hypothetical protein
MCGTAEKPHNLGRTSILEDIILLRDDAVDNIRKCAKKQADDDTSDLDIDAPSREQKHTPHVDIPPAVDIRTPDIGSVTGIIMKVLSAKSKTLYVEATSTNIDYLISAVAHQINTGAVKQPDHKTVHGAVFCKKRQSYRVLYMDADKKKYKYFRPGTTEGDIYEFMSKSSAE